MPHDRGCVAHSDGDVLLHCVVDAITGALGLPDIGQLFPDNDPKWKGQTSDVFIHEAIRLMKEAGYELGNIDCTLIAQRPKISPHKEKIKKNLAKLLDVHESVVNVKAKTHEKVDSLGENRSIACHTVVMLIKSVKYSNSLFVIIEKSLVSLFSLFDCFVCASYLFTTIRDVILQDVYLFVLFRNQRLHHVAQRNDTFQRL